MIWIGFKLSEYKDHHVDFMNEFGVESIKAPDGSCSSLEFALTKTGEPVCIPEILTEIATRESTVAILMDDW